MNGPVEIQDFAAYLELHQGLACETISCPVYKGRHKVVDDEAIRQQAAAGKPKAQIARELGVSRMTVYRALQGATLKANDVKRRDRALSI